MHAVAFEDGVGGGGEGLGEVADGGEVAGGDGGGDGVGGGGEVLEDGGMVAAFDIGGEVGAAGGEAGLHGVVDVEFPFAATLFEAHGGLGPGGDDGAEIVGQQVEEGGGDVDAELRVVAVDFDGGGIALGGGEEIADHVDGDEVGAEGCGRGRAEAFVGGGVEAVAGKVVVEGAVEDGGGSGGVGGEAAVEGVAVAGADGGHDGDEGVFRRGEVGRGSRGGGSGGGCGGGGPGGGGGREGGQAVPGAADQQQTGGGESEGGLEF